MKTSAISATSAVQGPDFTKPYVVINDDGTWGGEVYHKVRDLRPGVGEYVDRHGGLCEIPHHRMKLVAFEPHAPPEPTPEERVAADETRRYRTRSRVSAPQRAKKPAATPQIRKIRYLAGTLGISQARLQKMLPRGLARLEDLMLWEASRLIDRLQEV